MNISCSTSPAIVRPGCVEGKPPSLGASFEPSTYPDPVKGIFVSLLHRVHRSLYTPPPAASGDWFSDAQRRWCSPDPKLALDLPHLLHPTLVGALNAGEPQAALRQVGEQLWTMSVFSEEGCARLSMVIDDHLRWRNGQPFESPNSMHFSGVVMADLGLEDACHRIRKRIMRPIGEALFPHLGTLDGDYSFAATYGRGLDNRLNLHVDASEVTLNVCLGHQFSGGALVFQGLRCANHRQHGHRPDEEVHVTLKPGEAIVHAGAHRHLVLPVEGERRNLIMWCRSSAAPPRNQPHGVCPDWCGHRPKAV